MLYRVEMGNLSIQRVSAAGCWNAESNFGPGYRIYSGRDGDTLITLLGGGTKARQRRDIEAAVLWREHRRRKRQEG